ncbi:hypothetical protein D3C74_183110 [compost metagenome]
MNNLNHLLLPDINIQSIKLLPEHEEWLKTWLFEVEQDIENGDTASSICLQGIISELVLYKEIRTDWLGILKEYLTDENGNPIAYSRKFGERLFKFDGQWLQTPVHAVYTHWWIEKLHNTQPNDAYYDLIESFIQNNGWIYNPSVSPTNVRTRMKSELLMSFAMGIEMLNSSNRLTLYKERFEATLVGYPMTGFIAAEYFRLKVLQELGILGLLPATVGSMIKLCEAGQGYCDFAVQDKVDDYMGTAKRTQRDKAIHSPMVTLYVKQLSNYCEAESRTKINNKIISFGEHLYKNPLDVPAFRMRDIDIPFGTDLSPFEIISSSHIIGLYHTSTM